MVRVPIARLLVIDDNDSERWSEGGMVRRMPCPVGSWWASGHRGSPRRSPLGRGDGLTADPMSPTPRTRMMGASPGRSTACKLLRHRCFLSATEYDPHIVGTEQPNLGHCE